MSPLVQAGLVYSRNAYGRFSDAAHKDGFGVRGPLSVVSGPWPAYIRPLSPGGIVFASRNLLALEGQPPGAAPRRHTRTRVTRLAASPMRPSGLMQAIASVQAVVAHFVPTLSRLHLVHTLRRSSAAGVNDQANRTASAVRFARWFTDFFFYRKERRDRKDGYESLRSLRSLW